MNLYQFLRPLIFKLEPEKAHNLAIGFLKYFPNLATIATPHQNFENLHQKIWGINFKSPIGMAAGFDKNGEAIKALHQFGFGFVEAGTVTPKAQNGNEKPRLFRLTEDQAIINRLGFNNKGCEVFLQNISHIARSNIILGINIGKNKDSESAIADYLLLLEKFYDFASYITINISSPNTKNLRDLQKENQLDLFLREIISKKNDLKAIYKKDVPLWLKIAPDLDESEQEKIAFTVLKNKIDAVIISNTTISRSSINSAFAQESGGLSGKPLFDKSTQILNNFYKYSDGKIPLIGVGGISSAQDAYTKIKSGASLIQIYSSFIYQGFGIVEKITQDLSNLVKKDGLKNISQAIGLNHK